MGSFATIIFLFLTVLSDHSFFAAKSSAVYTVEQLSELVHKVRGEDYRMVRWDATKHTVNHQQEGGGTCDVVLPAVLEFLSSNSNKIDDERTGLACEFVTFCVTDNPGHRATLHTYPGVFQTIVKAVQSASPYTSAMAAHVIYISSFANAENVQGFEKAGAVAALARVIKNERDALAFQTMWAAAALQNLAASYCATGRCYWDWSEDTSVAFVEITTDSLPVISDGSSIRREVLRDTDLVERLIALTCQGPVHGKRPSNDNPFPGDNAVVEKHDSAPSIVPWAAAGALKNLALEPAAANTLEPVIACLCRMQNSPDWLEENKGEGALHHLRRGGPPCWMDGSKLCVDARFLDDEGYTCTDYGDASKEECAKPNAANVTPNDACCACGGGVQQHGRRTEEL